MTGFELVFITDPAMSDKELESLQKNIKMSISKSEGELVHEYLWGRRRLAYEIGDNDFGVYHTWYFRGSGSTVNELQRQFGYSDNVLRHQIVKVEDIDTEAAFMQSLIPPKDERIEKESSAENSQPKQESEKTELKNSDNENLDEEEEIETEEQLDSDKEESENSGQETDTKS
tara:strand:+ start:942 stop:1460 length:519 start_codon:yes stop_codon:yes gene_type:complete